MIEYFSELESSGRKSWLFDYWNWNSHFLWRLHRELLRLVGVADIGKCYFLLILGY